MNRIPLLVVTLFACLVLLVIAEPVLADCGCGGGARRPPSTHSKLSGVGVGMAGIALAWGAIWIGNRVADWMNRK